MIQSRTSRYWPTLRTKLLAGIAVALSVLLTSCTAQASSLVIEHLESIGNVRLSVSARGGMSFKPIPELNLSQLTEAMQTNSTEAFERCGISLSEDSPQVARLMASKTELPEFPGYALVTVELVLTEPAHLVRQLTAADPAPTIEIASWHDQSSFVANHSMIEEEVKEVVTWLTSKLAAKIAQASAASGESLSAAMKQACFESEN